MAEDEQQAATSGGRKGNAHTAVFQAYIPKQEGGLDSGLQNSKHKEVYVESNLDASPIPGLNTKQYHVLSNYLAEKRYTYKNKSQLEPNMTGKTNQGDDWFIDSGCTENMTHRAKWQEGKVVSKHEYPVVIPNGDSILVKCRGNYTLPNGTAIKEVLYVPGIKCNLLSVSRLS